MGIYNPRKRNQLQPLTLNHSSTQHKMSSKSSKLLTDSDAAKQFWHKYLKNSPNVTWSGDTRVFNFRDSDGNMVTTPPLRKSLGALVWGLNWLVKQGVLRRSPAGRYYYPEQEVPEVNDLQEFPHLPNADVASDVGEDAEDGESAAAPEVTIMPRIIQVPVFTGYLSADGQPVYVMQTYVCPQQVMMY